MYKTLFAEQLRQEKFAWNDGVEIHLVYEIVLLIRQETPLKWLEVARLACRYRKEVDKEICIVTVKSKSENQVYAGRKSVLV